MNDDILPVTESDDELLFASESVETGEASPSSAPWKIMVVDDEVDVHGLTQMVLSDFTFHGRGIEMLNAYSAEEARQLLTDNPDAALILLDVVMEQDHSGLELVRHIRDELENECIRIILRTGQPGQAPESRVIVEYDINDYKEKAELTSQKLTTAIVASLRSYQAIREVAKLNAELEQKVEERTADLHHANQKLRETLRQLEEDEEAGKRIQCRLLPDPALAIHHLHFTHTLRPSMYLSGDFVDYFALPGGEVGFYMADVSGHGVASAFVTVLLKSFISKHLAEGCESKDSAIHQPASLLEHFNRELLAEDLGKHLTLFYGIWNETTQRLRYCNGGHFPYPILTTLEGVTVIEEKCPAVGLFDFSNYSESTCTLPEAFTLTLCSDGLLDVLPQRALDDKTEALHQACRDMPMAADTLLKCLAPDAQAGSLPDDITVLTVHHKNGSTP
ncbi:MAG: PP2C family protein-serine/threonine phosphatase [Planctomycetota bacterium]|jgi:serine phosphatase RsbU (regulator of sigma subunit)